MQMSIYDTFMLLPLFQGLGYDELIQMLEKAKLHFHKAKPGEIIVKQNEKCNKLVLLLQGSICSHISDKEQKFALEESLQAPLLIEPHSLFGTQPKYKGTYKAETDADLFYIDKTYLINEMMKYTSFQINYLNLLSARLQVSNRKIWQYKSTDITQKIYNFVFLRCEHPAGEKRLFIRMEDLASLIGETRANVSKELNLMNQKGLVLLKRKNILIPALEKLI